VTREFRRQGYRVRALTRTPDRLAHLREHIDEVVRADLTDPAQLEGICRAGELVFSCAGASMALDDLRDRRSFTEIDYQGNLNLLQAARRAGVRKLAYVSLFGGRELLHTEYAAAHERFVDALRASGLAYTVIRPTGYFSFFAEILKLARQGRGMVIGSGEAHTNPIHEAVRFAELADDLLGGVPRPLHLESPFCPPRPVRTPVITGSTIGDWVTGSRRCPSSVSAPLTINRFSRRCSW
jgi:uncharacterized protein YbjT (DUF2867 family)